MRRQHRALRHVGHKVAFALMKPNQHHALFAYEAHRQTGPVPVSPGRPFNGTQDHPRSHFPNVGQVVFQHPLFDCDLGCRMQMLHLATAARPGVQTEVRTHRAHPLGRFLVDRGHYALVKTAFATVDLGAHHLIGQCAVDEHHLAVIAVCHALRLQIQRVHPQLTLGQRRCVWDGG